ncbi:YwmB family TATA-box binding protein [Sporolactobacillus sp. CQH2019]|uniref:YwmB family TATA-box binding protein n=1 Tax=Sporolactobacillus sp. CQH2019 TaxID=3023512 RepID=UPI002368B617|nr:YwmB family TATA-box binding protein [Sporolactobacillus sp. CQH2019]MDD9148251.1 YwmB family TATA-box binding protein [Sporolactobacillus sp. CQH2019]
MFRNLLFALAAFLIASLIFSGTYAGKAADNSTFTGRTDAMDRVPLFVKALKERSAAVDSWTVYAREQQQAMDNEGEFQEKAGQMTGKFAGYAWHKIGKKDEYTGWEGVKKSKPSGTEIRITYLAYPVGSRLQTALLYQFQNHSFQADRWPAQEQQMKKDMAEIFSGQEQFFSCVKAHGSDKMSLGLSEEGERYLKLFSAVPIEQVDEKTFVSISAYTKTWNDGIYSGKQKMNLQVALRNDDGRVAITLGTPIITVEY